MIDAFIIDELKRREREEEHRRDQERPFLELPLPMPISPDVWPTAEEDEDAPERGVVIIDFAV